MEKHAGRESLDMHSAIPFLSTEEFGRRRQEESYKLRRRDLPPPFNPFVEGEGEREGDVKSFDSGNVDLYFGDRFDREDVFDFFVTLKDGKRDSVLMCLEKEVVKNRAVDFKYQTFIFYLL
ncbi:hypothetical protein CEXT_64811 [Caerostris extrusa]|uniref:Uncharacterized protein n=1 Tax=Caerostris extrusa TaxID=172846 RepID=A0AAV4Y9E7_CAEEX|nr:hypothetical protein CEXT_64811 [Caerostris extrusa]